MTDIKRDGPAQGRDTIAVWGGEREHEPYERATQVPVVHSVSFGYRDLDTWLAVALGREEGHIYSRNTNPTVRAFEEKVRDLEAAEAATSFATRHGRHQRHFFHLSAPRRAGRFDQGQLRGHEQAVHRIPARVRHRGDAVRDRRSRRDRGRDRPRLQAPVPGVPHQPDREDHRHRPPRRRGPPGGRAGRGGQHLRHAHQSESFEPRRRPGAAQRDQISGRACRCLGRRGLRAPRARAADVSLP